MPKNSFDRDGSESILKIAKVGVERTSQHISNNLYSVESLKIRYGICRSIYSQETEHEINIILEKVNSKTKEKRLKAKKNIFIIKLSEARYKYFKVIKEKGFVK
ncbi:MAG: hypothetical protein PVI26_01515 [Chitinispirillia bacterium]